MSKFFSRIYEMDGDWRSDPISENQLSHIERLGLKPSIKTKGEAADIISSTKKPTKGEIKFLKFFGVELPKNATQLDVKHAISNIQKTPGAKEKWYARPAEKYQREIIRFVDGKVPRGLRFDQAKKLINTYHIDAEKSKKLEEYEDIKAALEERNYTIKSTQETINDDLDYYGLQKKVTIKEINASWDWIEHNKEVKLSDEYEELEMEIARHIVQNHPEKATEQGVDSLAHFRTGTSKINQWDTTENWSVKKVHNRGISGFISTIWSIIANIIKVFLLLFFVLLIISLFL